MKEQGIYFNGVDGETGEYLVSPMDFASVKTLISEDVTEPAIIQWLKRFWDRISQPHLGPPIGVDLTNISEAGWAIVFHIDEDPQVRKALQVLIDHRISTIGGQKTKVLDYQPNETWKDWLARHKVGPGSIIPTEIPYYILLIGSPSHIAFSFQYYLGVEYAVGRLSFDTADEYRTYAESVVAYETQETVQNSKAAVMFGPRHEFDRATQLSADLLITPLADGTPSTDPVPAQPGVAQRWGFASHKFVGKDATKANLRAILNGSKVENPAFLFTASHGIGFPKGHPEQLMKQGALLCQDWPGIGKMNKEYYLAATDIPDDAQLGGMINFHFACYGAGTPQRDNFMHKAGKQPPEIAEVPFVAMLPRCLLAHPNGGALAVIGHIDRAWGYSIITPNAGPQLLPFENAIGYILTGHPIGYALKDFNERYAALSVNLAGLLEKVGFGARIDVEDLVATWVERNDAQNYIILGDPAVRLRVDAMS